MCGIAGIFGAELPGQELVRLLEAMNDAQAHRGPDESGTVWHEALGAGLASCRLSIIDLEHGRQPIAREDGTIHVVLNGEIYNHHPLRDELASKGHHFGTRSDTEVLVHLYEESGESLLGRLEGMFALAILDTRRQRLLLARDGPGMKPLYLAETPHGFLFASEAKALFATQLISPEPDPAGIDAYLSWGCAPAPMSMFRGVRKLPAGHYAVIDRSGFREGTFWRFQYQPLTVRKSEEEYAEELHTVLARAVRSHLAADVPVGAFLSGGWDSSLTTTLAAQVAGRRLKTFSVVFPEDPGMDESRYSRQMAQHLGTDHYEIEFRASRMPEVLPKLTRSLEEPCTAAPAGPVFTLASLGAGHVKTVISGEGADELFGGYEWVRLEWPYRIRRVAPHWPFRLAGKFASGRASRALRILGATGDRAADAEWRRYLAPETKSALLKPEYRGDRSDIAPVLLPDEILAPCSDSLQRRLAFDFTSRLAEGILFMTDKVSMAHSLEVRMPFLDRAVVDFALRLPSSMKVQHAREKRVVAALARRLLPREIAERRKHGLGYPKNFWRRPSLAPFVRQFLLDPGAESPFVRSALEKHVTRWLAGNAPRGALSGLIFLQYWWNEFIAGGSYRYRRWNASWAAGERFEESQS